MLSRAGAHVPVIPSIDDVGRAASGAPEHIGATGANVGVVLLLTTIVNVADEAH